ncbi:MAG: pseudouridine synthase [Bacteroidetes bacterium]|nr:pseudouridine synthase [Bacteroidota bacterium]
MSNENQNRNESGPPNLDGTDGLRRRKRISRNSIEDKPRVTQERPSKQPQEVRLNKFISNCGICSRREADEIISEGRVMVNGTIIKTLGHKVVSSDSVSIDGKVLTIAPKIYVILNKPKDYITTTNDPQNRRTVMELIEDLKEERVYPVGRLDRNTTGILIFTNDGELSQRLMHPKSNVPKVYSVTLNKPLEPWHYQKLQKGIMLFDGLIRPDKIAFIDALDKTRIGVEIHSGRNRVVRRMFEALGYEVEKLDRVIYAGLDKSGLQKGKWRHLSSKEVHSLKTLVSLK